MFSYQEKEEEFEGLSYQMRSFDFNNIGVEMVAEWHKRNLFIYRNILEATEENDRVLIIIGSGHVRYLMQFLADNPAIEAMGANKFLRMKKTILMYMLLMSFLNVSAQVESVPMALGLGGGVDIISNKDVNASPLTYNGFGLPLGINGYQQSDKWINHFEIQLILPVFTNNYALKSRAKTKLVDWAKVQFKYRLLRRTGKGKNNFLGGELKSSVFYRAYDFLDGYGWEFQSSLSVSYARKIELNTKAFVLPQISLPLFGYINRKPAITYDEIFLEDFIDQGAISLLKYGKWKTIFNEWTAFEFDLLYHVNLSERFNFQSSIGFNYYAIRFPEKVQHLNIPIRCYINYRL